MAERKAVTKQLTRRYQRASKKEKTRMLDELCELTDWTRRHARRALVQAASDTPARPRVPRERTYGEDVVEPLRIIWATLNGPAGKRRLRSWPRSSQRSSDAGSWRSARR